MIIISGNRVYFLSRRFLIKINGNEGIKNVRNPGGHHRTQVTVNRKRGSNSCKKNIRETEC